MPYFVVRMRVEVDAEIVMHADNEEAALDGASFLVSGVNGLQDLIDFGEAEVFEEEPVAEEIASLPCGTTEIYEASTATRRLLTDDERALVDGLDGDDEESEGA